MKYLVICFALTFSVIANAKTLVSLYTYFDKPPFIVSRTQQLGLSYEFAKMLNKFSSHYEYELIYLPKNRALQQLDKPSALLWVNPAWVNDVSKTQYLWLDQLIPEKELYITNDANLIFNDDMSLFGKELVGVRGYTYINLQQYIESGNITRIDVNSEVLIPKMLLKHRGDFGVLGWQTFHYLSKNNPEYTSSLYILNGYQKTFQRGILVSQFDPQVFKEISSFIQSQQWQTLFDKWMTRKL